MSPPAPNAHEDPDAPPPSAREAATEHQIPNPSRYAITWRWARRLLQVGLPMLVIAIVWHELRTLDIDRIRGTLGQADTTLVVLGVAASLLAVVVMGLYDAVAFPRGREGTLSFARRWLMGATLFGWTNFVSMGPLGGPAIRLFAYRRVGLSPAEITRGFVGHYIGSSAGLAAWLLAAWVPLGDAPWTTAVRIVIALGASVGVAVLAAPALVPLLKRHRYGAELCRLPLARLGVISFFDWGLTLLAFQLLLRSVGVQLEPANAARTVLTGQLAGVLIMLSTPAGWAAPTRCGTRACICWAWATTPRPPPSSPSARGTTSCPGPAR